MLFLTCTALSYMGYACLRDQASPHAMLPQFQSAGRFLPDTLGNKEEEEKSDLSAKQTHQGTGCFAIYSHLWSEIAKIY